MKKRLFIMLALVSNLCAEPYIEHYDYLKKISDYTEIAIPILGFASVVANTDLAKGRTDTNLSPYGLQVSKKDRNRVGRAVGSYFGSLMHVLFYKQVVHEKRPIQGRESKVFVLPTLFDPSEFTGGHAFFSFPSSHCSKMFFGAATIHRELGFKVAAPFYLASAACSGIRLYRDNHFLHDVIAGAMIGAKLALSDNWANFVPTPTKNGGAVTISVKF